MTPGLDRTARRGKRRAGRRLQGAAAGALCALLAGCGGMAGSEPAGEAAAVAVPAAAGVGANPLEVQTGDFVSSGQVLRVRGTITNRSGQEVRGVRYRVRFLSHADADARLLGREEVVRKNLTLAAGEQKLMRFDVQSIYADIRAAGVQVDAWPITLGGREVPPPDDW